MGSFNEPKTIRHENWHEDDHVIIRPLTNGMRLSIIKRVSAKENGRDADKWTPEGNNLMRILCVLECVKSWTFTDEDGNVYPVNMESLEQFPTAYIDFIADSIVTWGSLPEGGVFL